MSDRKLQAVYVECDESYKRRVKVAAAERGVSVAALVREALDAFFLAQAKLCTDKKSHVSVKPTRYTNIKE